MNENKISRYTTGINGTSLKTLCYHPACEPQHQLETDHRVYKNRGLFQ